MKTLLLFFLLITANCFAQEKLFQDYFDTSSSQSARCSRAADSLYAIPAGEACSLMLKIHLFQKPGANLIRLAKEKHYRSIYFWVEERIEDGSDTWKRVSRVKQYRYNDVFQAISFTPTRTGIFRAAIDYKGQRNFAETYDYQFKVNLR